MSRLETQTISKEGKSDTTLDQVVRRLKRLERLIEKKIATDAKIG
jgi:hypothetical protein